MCPKGPFVAAGRSAGRKTAKLNADTCLVDDLGDGAQLVRGSVTGLQGGDGLATHPHLGLVVLGQLLGVPIRGHPHLKHKKGPYF